MDDEEDFRPTFATNRPGTGETVADAINALLRGMRAELAIPPPVAIATAFFNPGGFRLIADELELAGPARLLLGAEPQPADSVRVRPLSALRRPGSRAERARWAAEEHRRDLAAERDMLGFTREATADARRLVTWLRGGLERADGQCPPAEVRLYRGGFLHGKAFIVSARMPHVVSGSSNFTRAGLAVNRELNLGQFDPIACGRVRRWFEELWAESEPYDLASLYESRWEPRPPWQVFLRMLQELYGAELAEEAASRSPSRLGLTGFQSDGAWRARRILARHHGVIVADEVGLGKTYIAGELIAEAAMARRQKVLVVAPAILRDSTWEPFRRDSNLPADIVSFEELATGLERAGLPGSPLQQPDQYALIVVDEAHALRNPATSRADALRRLLAGPVPKDLVLLTATPVNNSLNDLYTLITYFARSDAAFVDSGIPSLKRYFERAMAMNPDDLSPEHLFDVIDQVAVRRTRRFVKHHYPDETVRIGGTEQVVTFPTPVVRRVDYDLGASMPRAFDMLAAALGARLPDGLPGNGAVLLDAPGEVLSLARYVPSRYRRSGTGTGEQYEQQNAGLLRSVLLKRFESSAHAFGVTIDKLIASHETFLDALGSGMVLTGDALRDWAASDSDAVDDLLSAYAARPDLVQESSGYRAADLRDAVTADRNLLRRLQDAVEVLPWHQDPKLLALISVLGQIAAEADREGASDLQARDKLKAVIFTNYADTAEHLAAQLRAAAQADESLSPYRDRIAAVSGGSARSRAEALAGFSPRTASVGRDARDSLDLLIATDALSEGVNLQQARHIINYDLPWNPMRLVQRHGRVDRIGSPHPEVFIRCFFPDQQLEAMLGLEERLQRKLRQAAAAVGVGEVLPGFAGQDVNFTETREEIARLRLEEANLFQEGGPSALSGEEYRRTLEHELADATVRTAVYGLPWGSGAGFARVGAHQPGLVFCARIADHPKPWFRYVPLTHDWQPQTDLSGHPVIIDDTLSCLAHAECDPSAPSVFAARDDSGHALYNAAFDSWAAARAHIREAWMRNADPASLIAPVPPVMRVAARLVRAHGSRLGNRQDELVDRLEAPCAPRAQRAIRDVLTDKALSAQGRAERLLDTADQLGLTRQPAPDPLPPIADDDIHLICWTAILPA